MDCAHVIQLTRPCLLVTYYIGENKRLQDYHKELIFKMKYTHKTKKERKEVNNVNLIVVVVFVVVVVAKSVCLFNIFMHIMERVC